GPGRGATIPAPVPTGAHKPWLAAAGWMGVIFLMSTDLGSSAHTSRFIRPLLLWLNPQVSPETIAAVQTVVRKCGHLSEYAVLGLLVLRAVRVTQRIARGVWSARAAGTAWLLCAAFAASDEYHQTFVASRTPAVGDVLIDSAGALMGMLLVFFWLKLRPARAYSKKL